MRVCVCVCVCFHNKNICNKLIREMLLYFTEFKYSFT